MSELLAALDRIRRVELGLAREAHAAAATALVRHRVHDLGNAVQIVRLASIEIERRGGDAIAPLVGDLRSAADQAAAVLAEMVAAAQPHERTAAGAPVAPAIRAAIDRARRAVTVPVALAIDLPDHVTTLATAGELEVLALAAVIEAAAATRITLQLRERMIEGAPWVELIRIDERADIDYDRALEPFEPLHVVAAIAEVAGGAATLSPGRTGGELVIALPQSPIGFLRA